MSDLMIALMIGGFGLLCGFIAGHGMGFIAGHSAGRRRERCSTLDTTRLHMLATHGSSVLSPPVSNPVNHRPAPDTLEAALAKHIRDRK